MQWRSYNIAGSKFEPITATLLPKLFTRHFRAAPDEMRFENAADFDAKFNLRVQSP